MFDRILYAITVASHTAKDHRRQRTNEHMSTRRLTITAIACTARRLGMEVTGFDEVVDVDRNRGSSPDPALFPEFVLGTIYLYNSFLMLQ